jgi:hypothetical protein
MHFPKCPAELGGDLVRPSVVVVDSPFFFGACPKEFLGGFVHLNFLLSPFNQTFEFNGQVEQNETRL